MTDEKPPGGGKFLNGDAFLATPQKQRKWIINPLIPMHAIVNLYGKPKTGKSFASFGMGLAIGNGDSHWNGFPVETHGPVAYLQIDTPEGEMWDRIHNVKLAGYDVSNQYFADIQIAPYPFNILLPQHAQWLKRELDAIQPILVFIDTLRESHEEDENDSKAMKRVINTLVNISRPAAVGLISHSRKDSAHEKMGAEADIMDGARGSSYVSGRMDTVIRFTGKDGKGHMHYLGRSKGANGKVPIIQDPDNGLVHISSEYAKREAIVLDVIRKHSKEWSVNKMSHEVSKLDGGITPRRAQDWIKKLMPQTKDMASEENVTE